MTVDEALRFGANALQKTLTNPRREAAWLLAAAMDIREIDLRLDPTRPLSKQQQALYRSWIERRMRSEPAQHLIGWCDFWGRRFNVSDAVLVPRPETEFLIEKVLQLPLAKDSRVCDIGTGSGCIAMTLKAERPDWRVAAVDVSIKALLIARLNRTALDLDVALINGDLGEALGSGWHLITANLPYIPSATLAGLAPEVAYDPVLALDGGQNGLGFIEGLIHDLARLLAPGGCCAFEIGENQADEVVRMGESAGLAELCRVRDLAGTERIIIVQKPARSESS